MMLYIVRLMKFAIGIVSNKQHPMQAKSQKKKQMINEFFDESGIHSS